MTGCERESCLSHSCVACVRVCRAVESRVRARADGGAQQVLRHPHHLRRRTRLRGTSTCTSTTACSRHSAARSTPFHCTTSNPIRCPCALLYSVRLECSIRLICNFLSIRFHAYGTTRLWPSNSYCTFRFIRLIISLSRPLH